MNHPYKRVLLKLSGEALLGSLSYGIDPKRLSQYVEEIKRAVSLGMELAIVIGGGNIFRGLQAKETGIERVQGDYMGMLATIINGMALQSALEQNGLYTRLTSSIEMQKVCEPYIRRRVIRHLEKKRIVILAGGTGNPFFTTDTAAALRANEIKADVLLKGTRVDGVYTSDPEKDPTATKYEHLSFDEVYRKELKVMDLTAITVCKENNLPIVVFNMNIDGNLFKLASGEKVGSLITVDK